MRAWVRVCMYVSMCVCVSACVSVSVQSSWLLCPFQHLEGKQREYEFLGLTPDTEFLGSIMISVPLWSKKSAPYVCRVKTLPGEFSRGQGVGGFLRVQLDPTPPSL